MKILVPHFFLQVGECFCVSWSLMLHRERTSCSRWDCKCLLTPLICDLSNAFAAHCKSTDLYRSCRIRELFHSPWSLQYTHLCPLWITPLSYLLQYSSLVQKNPPQNSSVPPIFLPPSSHCASMRKMSHCIIAFLLLVSFRWLSLSACFVLTCRLSLMCEAGPLLRLGRVRKDLLPREAWKPSVHVSVPEAGSSWGREFLAFQDNDGGGSLVMVGWGEDGSRGKLYFLAFPPPSSACWWCFWLDSPLRQPVVGQQLVYWRALDKESRVLGPSRQVHHHVSWARKWSFPAAPQEDNKHVTEDFTWA